MTIWRVERVIILFCYFNCNSSIYLFIGIHFFFFFLLLLLFLFYLSNFTTVILGSSNFIILAFSISIAKFYDCYFINFMFPF